MRFENRSSSAWGGTFKKLLPGKKFVLLARKSNLKPEAKKALSEILQVSPRASQGPRPQGVLRPPLGLHVPNMGEGVLPEVGRCPEVEPSDAAQALCRHGGSAPRRYPVLL